ncbi:MAG: hypothetical protein HUU14_04870 [Dehalococcoidia bacterium]|nr:hypothetical protein [Dehalococcoidia bacterium]NUQ55200.1 hypothetical protein [Dehalococcoidia bacterium]
MPTRIALLMPVAALAIVTVAIVALFAARSGPAEGSLSSIETPSETPALTPQDPALMPSGSVCQGSIRRPDPGEPRIYAPQYTRQREVLGIAVVGSSAVDERAFDEAIATIERFFSGNDLEERLAEEGAYIVIAEDGVALDELPEFACLDPLTRDDVHSACGIADRADYPVVAVDELDMTGNRRGPCRGLNILYHELGHLVQGWALLPADYFDVRIFYQAALDAGKYRNTYAASNVNEYFAEATQAYFLHSDTAGARDREWLRQYDPDLHGLLTRIYGE